MAKRAGSKPSQVRTDVVLFDTYSVLFRAFHALPRLSTSTGAPSAALFGFSSLVLKVLREQRPQELSFAVDAPTRTFRAERYPDYKAGRPRTPSELSDQIGRLPRLLDAFGVPVFCVPGFEADDVLATLAQRLAELGRNVLVVSGDRDLLQLANERTRVLFVGRRGGDAEVYDATSVEARFGVPPSKLPAFVALVGDPSDHLLGVPGVGPRTAAALVAEFGSMAELTANLQRVSAVGLREKLHELRERLLLNEELARLRVDVPLGTSALSAPLTDESLRTLRGAFLELEAKTLVERLDRLELARPVEPPPGT
jgi:DNA polymerase I